MMQRAWTMVGAVLLSAIAVRAASDRPQWQGPDRTRLSKETGLLKEWPASGPTIVWTASRSRRRLRFGGGRGRSRVRPGLARRPQRGHRTQPCRWQGSLVQVAWYSGSTIGDQDHAARPSSMAIGSTSSPRAATSRASRPTARSSGSAISSATSAAARFNGCSVSRRSSTVPMSSCRLAGRAWRSGKRPRRRDGRGHA